MNMGETKDSGFKSYIDESGLEVITVCLFSNYIHS